MTLPALVEFEVFRDHLGVEPHAPEIDDVSRLLDAICFEVRRLTRRRLEGDEGGSYDRILRLRGASELVLPEVPVASISSITPVAFDGTAEDPLPPSAWRLENPEQGHVLLLTRPEWVRVIWRTTGEIPASIPQAVLEWGKARWLARDRDPALASYRTGDDAEGYFEGIAGAPPATVGIVLVGLAHRRGGGVA